MIKFLSDNPNLNIVWILLGVGGIALVVFLLRKFVPGLKGEEIKEDEKEVAEKNVKAKTVEFTGEEKEDEE